jgi:hypothetical protein
MKYSNSAASLSIAAALSACSTVNSTLAERREVVEMHYVFDIETKIDTAAIAKATSDGLAYIEGKPALSPLPAVDQLSAK